MSDILGRHGIVVPGGLRRGQNRKTVCPKCSHTRRNKGDPCLSVKIEGDTLLAHCHHCGWNIRDSGADNDGAEPAARGTARGKGSRHRGARTALRNQFRAART